MIVPESSPDRFCSERSSCKAPSCILISESAQKRQFRVSKMFFEQYMFSKLFFGVAWNWPNLGFLDGFGIFRARPGADERRNFIEKSFWGEKIEKRAQKTSFSGFPKFRPRKLLSRIYLNSPSESTRLGRPDAYFTFEIGIKNKPKLETWRRKCPISRFFDF